MLATSGDIGTNTTILTKDKLLSDYVYEYNCAGVMAIDEYFMDENPRNVTPDVLRAALDFCDYSDEKFVHGDMQALDYLLTQMTLTGADCATIQGAINA